MSDLLATALALGFTLVVCLLAIQALLSPWLRVRKDSRRPKKQTAPAPAERIVSVSEPETVEVG